jgi:uncharacterized membrane protein YhaH (DUF805 family)
MDWKYILTSFEGRINRAKFWAGVAVLFVVAAAAAIIDVLIGTRFDNQPFGLLYVIVSIASIYFSLAVYAKRWHDRDKSGWWTLIVLVPIVGGLWLLIECGMLSGSKGPNRFGADPLG